MALMVNPEEGGSAFVSSPGRKLLHVTAIKYRTSKAGNQCVNARAVCLRDLDPKGSNDDTGRSMYLGFTLTPTAVFKVAQFANAVGQSEPFDAEDEAKLRKVLTSGPVVAMVELRSWDGKERAEARWYEGWSGDWDPSWDQVIEADRARDAEAAGGNGGGQRSAGTGGGQSAPQGGGYDDDIPFAMLIGMGAGLMAAALAACQLLPLLA